jgi:hypothetical protein
MQMGMNSAPVHRWGRIGLVALLGLTLALVTVTAGHAKAGHAVVAKKKKCKKKKHRSASTAKKKGKCKKVHHVVLPPPGPLTRATVTWSANNEVDLHAFDASGNHAGWDNNVGGVVNNIPNAHQTGDAGPGGPSESFVDDIFVAGGPSTREFAFVVCLFDNPGTDDYGATFTAVSKTGQSDSRSLAGTPSDGGEVYTLSFPGAPTVSDTTAITACGGTT